MGPSTRTTSQHCLSYGGGLIVGALMVFKAKPADRVEVTGAIVGFGAGMVVTWHMFKQARAEDAAMLQAAFDLADFVDAPRPADTRPLGGEAPDPATR